MDPSQRVMGQDQSSVRFTRNRSPLHQVEDSWERIISYDHGLDKASRIQARKLASDKAAG